MEKYTSTLNTDFVSRKATAQIEVNCELRSDRKISSLLGVTADAVAQTVESLGEEASVTGRVNFKAIYVDENGEIDALDYYSDFKTKVDGDMDVFSKYFAFAKVLECEVLSSDDEQVKARAVVEIDIVGVCKREVEYVDSDDLCKKTKMVNTSTLKEITEGVFEVGEDYESGEKVEKIVLLNTDIVLKEGKPSRGSLLVSGTVSACVAYKTEGGIKTVSLNLPFCEELEGENVTPLDDVYLYGYVKDARIVLSGEEDNTDIRVEVTVALRVPVFGIESKEVGTDAYSLDHAIDLSLSDGECYLKSGAWNYEERLSSSVVLPDDATSISRIIMIATPSDTVDGVSSEQDKISVLGSFTALLVYEDVDGLIRSFPLDLPYSVTFPAVGSVREGESYIRSAVCDVTAVAKRGREIEVMYVLKLYAYQCVREKFTYINDIREKDDDYEHKAITVYKRRVGDDAWDIAKALRVPVEEIECGEDKYIVCYKQLVE